MTMIIRDGFERPFAVNISPSGGLYVCDFTAGTVTGPEEKWAGFRGPHSIDWDNEGNAYICEFYGRQIEMINPKGERKIFIKDLPGPATAYFNNEKSELYVTDFSASRVFIYDLTGQSMEELIGDFNRPHQTSFDCYGNIYVADTHHHYIQKFDKHGHWLMNFGGGRLAEPVSISIEGDFVYVSEYCSDSIKRFTLEGHFADIPAKGFLHPYGVKINKEKLYVADSDHHCVKSFDISLEVAGINFVPGAKVYKRK